MGTGASIQKLEGCGYRVDEKNLTIPPAFCNTRTWQTDRRTDRQTDTGRQQRPRLRIASCGKKRFNRRKPYFSAGYGLAPIRLKRARLKHFYGGLKLRKSTAACGGGFGVYLYRPDALSHCFVTFFPTALTPVDPTTENVQIIDRKRKRFRIDSSVVAWKLMRLWHFQQASVNLNPTKLHIDVKNFF